MFTGLIQQVGEIVKVHHGSDGGRLSVRTTAWDRPLVLGESVAVNGACLTLVKASAVLEFDVLEETFGKTCLGEKKTGDRVNLERALRMGDPLGGHLVTGHIDGTASVATLGRAGRDWVVRLACSPDLLRGMVAKGSVACDGVSLTLVEIRPDSFTVHVLPHTWTHTAFSSLRPGDAVNIETDLLGKYVERHLSAGKEPGLTWDRLRETGFADG